MRGDVELTGYLQDVEALCRPLHSSPHTQGEPRDLMRKDQVPLGESPCPLASVGPRRGSPTATGHVSGGDSLNSAAPRPTELDPEYSSGKFLNILDLRQTPRSHKSLAEIR